MKLIDYIKKSNRRLISPVGGGTLPKELSSQKVSGLDPSDYIVACLQYRKNVFGHDFLESGFSAKEFCDCLGIKTFIENGFMNALPGQLTSFDDLERMKNINIHDKIIQSPSIHAVSKLKSEKNCLVGGGCFGPLTITGLLMGTEPFLRACRKKPNFVEACTDFFAEILLMIGQEYKKAGADYYLLGEPTSVMISPNQFRKFSGKYLEEIFKSLNIPGIIHVPGNPQHLIPEFLRTGAECLSLDSYIDTKEIMYSIPEDVIVLGNINTIHLLQESKEKIAEETTILNDEIKNFQNYIISSGGGIIEGTCDENIKTIFEITQEYPVRTNEEFENIRTIWQFCKNEHWEELITFVSLNKIQNELYYSALNEYIGYLEFQKKQKYINIESANKTIKQIHILIQKVKN